MEQSYLHYQGALLEALQQLMGATIHIQREEAVEGGCISRGRILHLSNGERLFMKSYSSSPRHFFKAEADNLLLLKRYCPLTVPTPLIVGESRDGQYLCLEYIDAAPRKADYWEHCGRGLAILHKESSIAQQRFGLDWDNWIGSTPQPNNPNANWHHFFAHTRLHWQLQLAARKGYLRPALQRDCNVLLEHVSALLPKAVRPELVHGDLWSGNLMSDSSGAAALIDPAVYFADREVDIAMTTLFGKFDDRFYSAYNECYPLAEGWEGRLQLYNLYHLLNHLNIFGTSYLPAVTQAVRFYS